MNARRGHESNRHLEMKVLIGQLFENEGYTVFYEQLDCDVLVVNRHTGMLTGIEIESSPRNVQRNIQRNSQNGCHAVAVVTLTESLHRQISAKANSAPGCVIPVKVFHYLDTEQLISWVLEPV